MDAAEYKQCARPDFLNTSQTLRRARVKAARRRWATRAPTRKNPRRIQAENVFLGAAEAAGAAAGHAKRPTIGKLVDDRRMVGRARQPTPQGGAAEGLRQSGVDKQRLGN